MCIPAEICARIETQNYERISSIRERSDRIAFFSTLYLEFPLILLLLMRACVDVSVHMQLKPNSHLFFA